MRETPAYQFLNDFGTLSFEATDTAVFWFRADKGITIDEPQPNERIAPLPLQNAQLVYGSGALAWGVITDSWGRSARVTQHGDELLDVRKCPALMDGLKKSGRFQAIIHDDFQIQHYLLSGPPLL